MLIREIREAFLKFFKEHQHRIVPSSPVVPYKDPTLLFTNAGMNQFKEVFLDEAQLEFSRCTSSQKCIRVGGKHNDLENVGHTSRHLTFFEMLGNFSFGDYFKKEAIDMAWDFSVNHLKLDADKIYVSVYHTDDEAYEFWRKHRPENRIVRIAGADNFWSMGATGPCGPCTELFFDRGSKYGNATSPLNDTEGERFFEFWNLVFMQYNQDQQGNKVELPKPCVDTGMGLERVVSLKMNVDNLFEIDLFQEMIHSIEHISSTNYKTSSNQAAYHVIADHIRTLAFAISDGAIPSNTDRGYVLRKILRRSVRYAKQIGLNEPFLGKLLPTLLHLMGNDYQELVTAKDKITQILAIEEETFLKTLRRGGNILNKIIESAKVEKNQQISGQDAFKLKDTYGLPIDEILLLAKDNHLEVGLETFQLLEQQAKDLSKQAHVTHSKEVSSTTYKELLHRVGPSQFNGYNTDKEESSILAIIKEGKEVDCLHEGETASILLDKTPFYAEMGGQVGDTGSLSHNGCNFSVFSTHTPYSDLIAHHGKLTQGSLMLGEPIIASIDTKNRNSIANNHTATHLLHYALKKVCGEHIKQAGSLVENQRLRFDFSHHQQLTKENLFEIEKIINNKIFANHKVSTQEVDYTSIKNDPHIIQFFGEKYGDKVRVVTIDDYSKELCGGTHVQHLSSLGLFKIIKESSIAAGVRRIEAVTSTPALDMTISTDQLLLSFEENLGTTRSKIESHLSRVLSDAEKVKKEHKQMRKQHLEQIKKDLMTKVTAFRQGNYIAEEVDVDKGELTSLASTLISELPESIILLCNTSNTECFVVTKVNKSLVKKDLSAKEMIKQLAPLVGGSGGGNDISAQAGGTQPENIKKLISTFLTLIK